MPEWICQGLPMSIPSVSIYYGPKSDIWVKSYGHFNLPRASLFNFERLDILWASIEHPSQKWSPSKFARGIHFQFRASRYIMGLNRMFESKVMAVWICQGIPCSILRDLIYYGPQSDFGVKSYGHQNMLVAYIFNFDHLDILWVSIRCASQKLFKMLRPFEFAQGFGIPFRAFRYITGLNQTSE